MDWAGLLYGADDFSGFDPGQSGRGGKDCSAGMDSPLALTGWGWPKRIAAPKPIPAERAIALVMKRNSRSDRRDRNFDWERALGLAVIEKMGLKPRPSRTALQGVRIEVLKRKPSGRHRTLKTRLRGFLLERLGKVKSLSNKYKKHFAETILWDTRNRVSEMG